VYSSEDVGRKPNMSDFVSVDQVEKSFPLSGGKEYLALKGIDLKI
jgi:bicarbonate transport system ATP-binding protein